MKEFIKSAAFRMLALVAALLVVLMVYAARCGGVSVLPKRVLSAAVSPLQTAASAVAEKTHGFFGLFGGRGALRRENEALREEIRVLREQQTELDELRRENALYRDYLGLKAENPDYRFVEARVIAADPADHYGNFTVNRGSQAGVKAGNPVITADGLVGVVWEVSATSSTVRTILDPRVQVSVYVSRTRDNGITDNTAAAAAEGLLRVKRLERTAGAVAGDMVVTYGSGNYPEGLLVGELTTIYAESDGLSLSATVRPFAAIGRVAEVFVITSFGEQAEG